MAVNRHGFSIVELIFVTALLGVIAGMSLPLVSAGMTRYAVTSASRQVAAAIRSVRLQAVSRNAVLRLHFDVGLGTYTVIAEDEPPGVPMSLPVGATFAGVSSDVTFDPAGRLTDSAYPVTIVIGNGHAPDNRTITVVANGRVQLR
jgi:prepilin-type N-terminal cleavage/methylation domain-containing protein